MGVDCKPTEVLVYAKNLIGRKYVFSNTGRVSHDKQVCFDSITIIVIFILL